MIPVELLEALPTCLCCDAETTRDEMIERHGTLESFSKNVEKAYTDLFITESEAERAIRKYRVALANAAESK